MMIRENLLPQLVGFGIKQGFGDHRLRVGPIKMFIDGSLIGRTAAVTQPFLKDPNPDYLGLMMMPQEQFEDYVMQAHTAGYQIAIHAIGDRGIDLVLDAYEKRADRHATRRTIAIASSTAASAALTFSTASSASASSRSRSRSSSLNTATASYRHLGRGVVN